MKMQKMIKADCNTNYTLNEAALQVPLRLFGKTCALEKVNRNSKATVNSTKVSWETNPKATGGPERSARLFCRRRSTVVPSFGHVVPKRLHKKAPASHEAIRAQAKFGPRVESCLIMQVCFSLEKTGK